MFQLTNTPGRACEIKGREFLFFSGYSYLGMSHVKEFRRLVKEGIDKYGILFPSSRISNTRLDLYEKFEKRLSEITGLEETVSFSSGFLAGKTIADILSRHANVITAPCTHPAIRIETDQLINAVSFDKWATEIASHINSSTGEEFVLLSDSVNILEAEVHDFSFLSEIASTKKIIFAIDDSHGIGLLGKRGEGIVSQLPKKENIEFIITYSLSKAFNIEGGAVSCTGKWATLLRQHPNYTGSTPISPALIHAFLKSKKIYEKQRKALMENISFFKKLHPPSFRSHDFSFPVFICKIENAERSFYDEGIIISSFGYPDPTSPKINRAVISALHTKKDLQELCRI